VFANEAFDRRGVLSVSVFRWRFSCGGDFRAVGSEAVSFLLCNTPAEDSSIGQVSVECDLPILESAPKAMVMSTGSV
jgi:hypothetical protein